MFSKVFFLILMVVSIALSLLLGWTLFSTNLISQQVTLLAVGMLVLLPLLLYLLQREKKGGSKKTGARVAAIVLLLFLCLIQGAVLFFLHPYNKAMDRMTDGEKQTTLISVYVKDTDKASEIRYAIEREYRFGVIADVDVEAVETTRAELESKYGRSLKIQTYANLLDLVKAMDNGDIDAMLISEAYFALIEDLEGYEDFGKTLRVLHTTSVETKIPVRPAPVIREMDPEIAAALSEPDLWENSFVAYISGIDTFGPVGTRSRSDVNILAIVNTETKTVLLISTPRDYYVPFNFPPANGALDKLTHAGIYGIEASMQALGDYYGLPIEYYMRVNFTGFVDIIDALGGVDVEYDPEYIDDTFNYDSNGMAHMNGKQALKFVRIRKAYGAGDRVRGRHQMQVIKGVIKNLASSKLITNYADIMVQLGESFQTNLSKQQIGELVQLTLDRSKGDWKVLTYWVNGDGRYGYGECFSLGCKAYVMYPYDDTVDYAVQLAIAIASGETRTQDEIYANAPKH